MTFGWVKAWAESIHSLAVSLFYPILRSSWSWMDQTEGHFTSFTLQLREQTIQSYTLALNVYGGSLKVDYCTSTITWDKSEPNWSMFHIIELTDLLELPSLRCAPFPPSSWFLVALVIRDALEREESCSSWGGQAHPLNASMVSIVSLWPFVVLSQHTLGVVLLERRCTMSAWQDASQAEPWQVSWVKMP